MKDNRPRWAVRLVDLVEWGCVVVVAVAVIVWLFWLPVLGIRCWMAH